MQRSPHPWALGAALTAVAIALGLASCAKTQQTTTSTDSTATVTLTPEQRIERGRYLTSVSGCNDCHTPGTIYGAPDMSRQLSGSEVGWAGPWGTSYAANLTPDTTTGIGRYTEDDIVNALRKGIKASGAPVLPPMPWPAFANYTDEDAYAIAAYLKSIPAVVHAVPGNLPPGRRATAAIVIPPPTAWDAPKAPPAGSAPAGTEEPAPPPGQAPLTTPAPSDTL
jgi:mono/diheme cytochrome c family protein